MVGFVLVSHIKKLAEGAAELGTMMAPDVPVEAAGGLPDGSPGTDYERIASAIGRIRERSLDGVIVIPDMGSAGYHGGLPLR